jgi:hypothetical protein
MIYRDKQKRNVSTVPLSFVEVELISQIIIIIYFTGEITLHVANVMHLNYPLSIHSLTVI